jgi:hypothetical protein
MRNSCGGENRSSQDSVDLHVLSPPEYGYVVIDLLSDVSNCVHSVAYSPHVGDVEAQKPRGPRLRDSSGALPSLASPPFPSLHSAPCVARLRSKH